jgi:hypothetical protein
MIDIDKLSGRVAGLSAMRFFPSKDDKEGRLEITKIGEFWNIKVPKIRELFGRTPERPDGLTEKDIFNLAKLSTNKNIGSFNYMWNDNWALTTYNQQRPYDDCSILIFDCEIDCPEMVYHVDKIRVTSNPGSDQSYHDWEDSTLVFKFYNS